MSVKTLHTMSTIAPVSVTTGNLYLMRGEQQFVQFWGCSDWLSREDTSSFALPIANIEIAVKDHKCCRYILVHCYILCSASFGVQLTSSLMF